MALCIDFFQSQKINCIGISRSEHANSDYCVKNYSELSKLFDKDTYLISFAGDNRKIDENELQMVKDLSTTYQHQMFYISSAQVYGLKHNYSNIETSPLDGVTDYAKNKIIAEQLVKKIMVKSSGFQTYMVKECQKIRFGMIF